MGPCGEQPGLGAGAGNPKTYAPPKAVQCGVGKLHWELVIFEAQEAL